jgi:protein-tyrosine phosphatase
MAERLWRLALDTRPGLGGLDIDAASAGVKARTGEPMHPLAADALRALGADAGGFASRQVYPAMLAGSDLVLTAGCEQRAACVTLAPATLRRTFTLRQFGRLAAGADPARVRAGTAARRLDTLVEEACRVRGGAQPVAPGDDDVADPVAGSGDIHTCTAQILAALRPVLRLLADTDTDTDGALPRSRHA